MKAEVGRRIFVGSVVAGLPLAVWKAGAFAQAGSAGAHDHAAAAAVTDPVLEHVVRQIALIHNAAQAGPRGEHMRALASQLRVAAVYGRQIGVDSQVRRGVQDLVKSNGRNGVLFMERDERARRENMQRFGFRLDRQPARRPGPPFDEPTYQAREAALDDVLQEGVTPIFERLATVADQIAQPLDRARRGILTVQDDPAYWEGYCEELKRQIQIAQYEALPICSLAKWWPSAVVVCGALEGGVAVLAVAYLLQC